MDPAWFILYVLPAMVTEPLRAAPVLAETVIVTDLLPIPLVGERLIQPKLSNVVQLQLEFDVVTKTDSLPPFGVKLPSVEDML